MANGMKSKLFTLTKKDGKPYLSRHANTLIAHASDVVVGGGKGNSNNNNKGVNDSSEIRDTTREIVLRVMKGIHVDPEEAKMLKKRQLGSLESLKIFTYCKGAEYAPTRRAKAVGDLTREMLQDGS